MTTRKLEQVLTDDRDGVKELGTVAIREGLNPSDHGEFCIGNGEFPGIECLCPNCEHAKVCFPELN